MSVFRNTLFLSILFALSTLTVVIWNRYKLYLPKIQGSFWDHEKGSDVGGRLGVALDIANQTLAKKNEEIAFLKKSLLQKELKGPQAGHGTSLYQCDHGIVIPRHSQLTTMPFKQMADLYHSYVENVQVACGRMVRMGNQDDGGWEVCDDVTVRPNRGSCLVYSFGINNDFTFDDATAGYYGCEIHSFDPSMGIDDHLRSAYVTFHNIGLADFNGLAGDGWKMATLQTIREMLNHTQVPVDILKIDIEQWELQVFPHMITTGALHGVKQFVFEIHSSLNRQDPPDVETYLTALGIFRDLHDLGFRIYFTHRNRFCSYISKNFNLRRTACHEIYLMKVC